MAGWSVAVAIGISLTAPSTLHVAVPPRGDAVAFEHVRWAGLPFVAPPYYAVRIAHGNVALDYTHEKTYAATDRVVHERGTWHGEPVDDDIQPARRIEHFEISHGVNALALVAIARDPRRSGLYAAIGPLLYLPHAESTVDGKPASSGYALGGYGLALMAGAGNPAHRFADLKAHLGTVRVGVADGAAETVLRTFDVDAAP